MPNQLPNGLARAVVGDAGMDGGNGRMAGGQVHLNDRDSEMLARRVSQAVMAHFKISPEETSRSLL